MTMTPSLSRLCICEDTQTHTNTTRSRKHNNNQNLICVLFSHFFAKVNEEQSHHRHNEQDVEDVNSCDLFLSSSLTHERKQNKRRGIICLFTNQMRHRFDWLRYRGRSTFVFVWTHNVTAKHTSDCEERHRSAALLATTASDPTHRTHAAHSRHTLYTNRHTQHADTHACLIWLRTFLLSLSLISLSFHSLLLSSPLLPVLFLRCCTTSLSPLFCLHPLFAVVFQISNRRRRKTN